MSWCLAAAIVVGLAGIVSAQSPAIDSLPETWLGAWQGTMENLGGSAAAQSIPVELTITRRGDGSYSFRTVYNQDPQRGLRDYVLQPISGKPGWWEWDEQNGIRLQARWIDGQLLATFEVAEQALCSRYTLNQAGELVHEVLFWSRKQPQTTQGTGDAGEGGQPVESFSVGGLQKSVFQPRKSP